jgi:hypothetical protein
MRLADWPRMPYLNEEVRAWIAQELQTLGADEHAVYATEHGPDGDERRILVATEVGLLDHVYAPFGTSARYRLTGRLYPWQTVRGLVLLGETFRVWAHEHTTRWTLRLEYPRFDAASDSPELGRALVDLGRVCAVMSEPFGVPEVPAESRQRASSQTATPIEIESRGVLMRSGLPATPAAAGMPGGDSAEVRPVGARAPNGDEPRTR